MTVLFAFVRGSGLIFVVTCVALFAAVVAVTLLGRAYAERRWPHAEETSVEGTTAVEGSVFALFGLLVAFSFAGAESRLDARRDMVVDEANAIEIAYLRMDLLP